MVQNLKTELEVIVVSNKTCDSLNVQEIRSINKAEADTDAGDTLSSNKEGKDSDR